MCLLTCYDTVRYKNGGLHRGMHEKHTRGPAEAIDA